MGRTSLFPIGEVEPAAKEEVIKLVEVISIESAEQAPPNPQLEVLQGLEQEFPDGQPLLESLSKGYKLYKPLISQSLLIGLASYGYDLLNMYGFYQAGRSHNPQLEASFGLMVFFNTVLVFGFYYSIDEKIGVTTGIAYGAGDFVQTRRVLRQGLLTICLLAGLYFLPMVYFSDQLLPLLGISGSSSTEVRSLLMKLYPVDVARMLNELMLTFCLAQGVEFNFGFYATINMVVSLASGILVDWLFGIGIDAWLVARIVHEVILTITYVYPFLRLINPETIWRPTQKKPVTETLMPVDQQVVAADEDESVLVGYSHFLKDCGRYSISLYSEWLGLEIAIFFTSQTKSDGQIAAHTAVANIAYFVVNTGIGFSTIGRVRINMLLGKGLNQAAKIFFKIYSAGSLAVSLIFSATLMLLKTQILEIYGGQNQDVREWLEKMLLWYIIFLPLDFLFPFLFTVCRSTNHIMLTSVLNVGLLICTSSAVDYYLVYIKSPQATCVDLLIVMYTMIACIFGILTTKLLKTDWNSVKAIIDED